MFYIDANIFVYSVFLNDKGEKARQALQLVQDSKIHAITSVLTFDEVVWSLRKHINEETAIAATKSFFLLPELAICDVTHKIFLDSLDIMQHEKMKPRDAIHVATMRENKILKIISEDSDFDKIKNIKRISLDKLE